MLAFPVALLLAGLMALSKTTRLSAHVLAGTALGVVLSIPVGLFTLTREASSGALFLTADNAPILVASIVASGVAGAVYWRFGVDPGVAGPSAELLGMEPPPG